MSRNPSSRPSFTRKLPGGRRILIFCLISSLRISRRQSAAGSRQFEAVTKERHVHKVSVRRRSPTNQPIPMKAGVSGRQHECQTHHGKIIQKVNLKTYLQDSIMPPGHPLILTSLATLSIADIVCI